MIKRFIGAFFFLLSMVATLALMTEEGEEFLRNLPEKFLHVQIPFVYWKMFLLLCLLLFVIIGIILLGKFWTGLFLLLSAASLEGALFLWKNQYLGISLKNSISLFLNKNFSLTVAFLGVIMLIGVLAMMDKNKRGK